MVYAYANNHCAGHAPATIETFRDLCREGLAGTRKAIANSFEGIAFVRVTDA
jgi:hypothetical protein